MKRTFLSVTVATALACALLAPSASAATEAQKLAAIQAGLAHLVYVQCQTSLSSLYGSWAYGDTNNSTCASSYPSAFTGMVVLSFMARTADWPSGLATTYQADVDQAIKYPLSTATTETVSLNLDSVNICPSGGSCVGIYWNTSNDPTYDTGFVAQAMAVYALYKGPTTTVFATGHALDGMTYQAVAQGITNFFAATQAGSVNGGNNGGWRYGYSGDIGDSDMSTTQWGAIASGYDESVGAVTPSYVKAHLKIYLPTVLTGSGSSACYQAGCGIGPTFGENGGWLTSNSYTGNTPATGVVSFLNNNWKTAPSGDWYGNFGHSYGMWAAYKGLNTVYGLADNTHITNKLTDCGVSEGNPPGASAPSGGVCNWWEDYNEWLVNGTTTYPTLIPNTINFTDGGGNKYWNAATVTGETGYGDPLTTGVAVAIIEALPIPQTITAPNTVPAVPTWGLVALGVLLAGFAATRMMKHQEA